MQTFGHLLEHWVRRASAQGNLGILPTIGVAADIYLRGLVTEAPRPLTYRVASPLWPAQGTAYRVTLGTKCPDDVCTGELCEHTRAMDRNPCSHILAARLHRALGAPAGPGAQTEAAAD